MQDNLHPFLLGPHSGLFIVASGVINVIHCKKDNGFVFRKYFVIPQRFIFSLGCGLLLIAMLLTRQGGWAAERPALETMETTWLQQTYDAEPTESRLQRLELTLFGNSHDTATTEERLESLQQLFNRYQASQPVTQQGLPVAEPTSPADVTPIPDTTTEVAPVSPPLIGALEQVILNRRFDDQADSERLKRLEWKTFLTTFESQPLDERLDRLVRRYPQAIEYARSNVNFQQSRSSQTAPVYTPPQVRPAVRP